MALTAMLGHSQVVAAVVGVLLPAIPELDDEGRAATRRDVTEFVASQIENMPSFMRLPYRVALTAFDWLPLLRYGRPFHRLDREAQDRYLALWSGSPLGVMRDFVKLMRSCALLAYFDHPLVRERIESNPMASAPRGRAAFR